MNHVLRKGLGSNLSIILILFIVFLQFPVTGSGQCKPAIRIDGELVIANEYDEFGLHLPFWMKAGQTLSIASSVRSISVIEFTETDQSLEYSQVLSITSDTPVEVPEGKVWKVESIAKLNNSSSYRKVTFTTGTYTWKVPGCAFEICVEAWAGGGGGGGNSYNSSGSLRSSGGGGGGGGFASGCFPITPGTDLTITVGGGGAGALGVIGGVTAPAGANGGPSSVGSLITVTGGNGGGGGNANSAIPGAAGAGGTSTADSVAEGAPGGVGAYGTTCCPLSGKGGSGGNGGAGGNSPIASPYDGQPGLDIGGGGSGAGGSTSAFTGGKGADGKVVISW